MSKSKAQSRSIMLYVSPDDVLDAHMFLWRGPHKSNVRLWGHDGNGLILFLSRDEAIAQVSNTNPQVTLVQFEVLEPVYRLLTKDLLEDSRTPGRRDTGCIMVGQEHFGALSTYNGGVRRLFELAINPKM